MRIRPSVGCARPEAPPPSDAAVRGGTERRTGTTAVRVWTSLAPGRRCWSLGISIPITVLMDLFRRHDVSGWGRAAWTVFLIVLPFLGVFTYLITQAKEMAERRAAEMHAARDRG